MNLEIKVPKISLRAVLVSVFLLALFFNFYLGYTYLYTAYVGQEVQVPEDSVVRVDVPAYRETIEYLESLDTFVPQPVSLPRANPFQ
jgi:hypothetical protein